MKYIDCSSMGNLPTQMDKVELDEFVEYMQRGIATKNEEDQVILSHLRMAIAMVGNLASRYHIRDIDEFVGEAGLILTEAVKDFPSVSYDNEITKYIRITLKNRLKDFLERRSTVSMSGRTIRHNLAEGINSTKALHPLLQEAVFNGKVGKEAMTIISKLPVPYQAEFLNVPIEELDQQVRAKLYTLLPVPKLIRVLEDYETDGDSLNEGESSYKGRSPYAVPVAKPVISPEFIEALQQSIKTPIQEYIIGMRAEGYTYEEISKKIGLSRSKVGNLVTEIEARFNRIYFNEKDSKRV